MRRERSYAFRPILLLSAGMFALGLDAYVVAGLLPGISQTFGISASAAGLTVGVFTLSYALAAPVFATLLAGRPARRVLALALAVFTLANVATALATSFFGLLVARAVAGAGAGLYSPLAAAAGAALVSERRRGRVLGFALAGMSMGTVIGVPLGLQIADHVGWRGALWLVAGLGFAALAGLLLRFPDIPTASTPSLRQRAAMLADRRVAATVGVTFLTGAAGLGLYTYLAPILHEITGHDWLAPYLWAWGFGGIVGSFSIGFLIDLTGRPRQLMALILTFMALAMLALPLALQFPVLGLLPFIVWGAAGWASPAPQQHALLALHPHNGAAAIALNSSVNYLGSATGAGLGGLAMTAGLPAAQLPFVAGGVALLALLGELRLLQLRKIECASGKSGAGEPEGRLNAARD